MKASTCDGFRDRLPNGICMGGKGVECERCLNCKSEAEKDAAVEKFNGGLLHD